jgi:hypothetical protein
MKNESEYYLVAMSAPVWSPEMDTGGETMLQSAAEVRTPSAAAAAALNDG